MKVRAASEQRDSPREESKNSAATEVNIQLLEAVKSKDLAKLKEAIDAGADANFVFENSRNALFFAIDSVNAQIVDQLIKHGADVNAKDVFGNTPLIYATKRKALKTVFFRELDKM